MKTTRWRKARGGAEYGLLLLSLVAVLAVLIFILGDTLRVQTGKVSSTLQGEPYTGYGNTRVTRARTKPRTLRNYDDARIRQDQYNRKHEPMRSRKGGNREEKSFNGQ